MIDIFRNVFIILLFLSFVILIFYVFKNVRFLTFVFGNGKSKLSHPFIFGNQRFNGSCSTLFRSNGIQCSCVFGIRHPKVICIGISLCKRRIWFLYDFIQTRPHHSAYRSMYIFLHHIRNRSFHFGRKHILFNGHFYRYGSCFFITCKSDNRLLVVGYSIYRTRNRIRGYSNCAKCCF